MKAIIYFELHPPGLANESQIPHRQATFGNRAARHRTSAEVSKASCSVAPPPRMLLQRPAQHVSRGLGQEPCASLVREAAGTRPMAAWGTRCTQFPSQDSGLFGPNPLEILAPPSNCLSKKASGQPLGQILWGKILWWELGVGHHVGWGMLTRSPFFKAVGTTL